MFISKKYKELGGTYSGKNEGKLKTWRDENWL